MYSNGLLKLIKDEVGVLKEQGKYKLERVLESPQGSTVKVAEQDVLMFASNNYLGLANHPQVIEAAKKAMDSYGYGMASVRFISGTTKIHLELEKKLAEFLHTDDAILFSSCFAANEAFFAALVHHADSQKLTSVIYSDELNHASIIDGLRLVKKEAVVKRIYPHHDLATLSKMLEEDAAGDYAVRIIATDGVFSMEGELAKLPELVALAKKHQALLFVDDSHGVGACGRAGKGSPDELNVLGQIDVLSGTLGKALGGAAGGYLAGKKELIDFLRQKARPYIFSNTLPPMIAGGSIAALELLSSQPELLAKLRDNTLYFRQKIEAAGFKTYGEIHPIVPIHIGEAAVAQKMSQELLKRGLFVVGLWFPVVAEGQARLRAQISAAHSRQDLDNALDILTQVGREVGLIK